jgi:hypothetical protein
VKRLDAPAETKLTRLGDAQVAHPLRLAARSNEIVDALVVQYVDGNRAPFAAVAPADGKDARAVYADPQASQCRKHAVQDVGA